MGHWHALSLMSPIASYTKAQISHLTHGPTLNKTHSLSRFFFIILISFATKTHNPNLPLPLWTASSLVVTCSPPPTWTAPSPATVQAIGVAASHWQVKPLPHAVHPSAQHHQQEQLLFSPTRTRWLGAMASTSTTNGTGCIHWSAPPIPHSHLYASSTNFFGFFIDLDHFPAACNSASTTLPTWTRWSLNAP